MNETQLIEGCKQHNPKAQKALYDTYARKMMSVCLRYGSNRETAEDLLQEGFIKVFSAIGSFEGSGSFEGWMRRIFVNTALEYLRKNDILKESVEIDNTEVLQEVDYSAIERISADELMELIAELPPGISDGFQYVCHRRLLP